jgi:flagellin
MALTISNNGAVQTASYYLDQNQRALQSSIKKLASGKKIVDASADPGTLSVAMKVRASINRLSGAQNNVQNGIGFLEVQDGLLETAGKIVMRMSELKGFASQDPMKGETDIASYNNEFRDLQMQLFAISQQDFNGMSLFARYTSDGNGGSNRAEEVQFNGKDQDLKKDHTIDIYTSTKGADGTVVSIHKSALLSALTISMTADGTNEVSIGHQYGKAVMKNSDANASINDAANITVTHNQTVAVGSNRDKTGNGGIAMRGTVATLASETRATTLSLGQISFGVFQAAVENVVFLRAQTGAGLSRLSFASESMAVQQSNMRSALGRIEDVDIAEEAANLAKYSILMQASAAMVAQANSTSQVALLLLQQG